MKIIEVNRVFRLSVFWNDYKIVFLLAFFFYWRFFSEIMRGVFMVYLIFGLLNVTFVYFLTRRGKSLRKELVEKEERRKIFFLGVMVDKKR